MHRRITEIVAPAALARAPARAPARAVTPISSHKWLMGRDWELPCFPPISVCPRLFARFALSRFRHTPGMVFAASYDKDAPFSVVFAEGAEGGMGLPCRTHVQSHHAFWAVDGDALSTRQEPRRESSQTSSHRLRIPTPEAGSSILSRARTSSDAIEFTSTGAY